MTGEVGPRDRRTQQRALQTRAALITAAVESLKDVGFAGTTARGIATRAKCHQSQVFYHFDSVHGLLLAALDDVSERRMTTYRALLDESTTSSDLLASAHEVIRQDLDSGDVAVLVEMMAGARSVPGLGAQVTARLEPWHEFAADAIRLALRPHPWAALAPIDDLAHALVAGVLGLELLAETSGDRDRTTSLFEKFDGLAALGELLTRKDQSWPTPHPPP